MARQKGQFHQCWGSVTFWCGFGSPDPYIVTYGSIYFLQYLPNFKGIVQPFELGGETRLIRSYVKK